jgi:hypothetical protein
MGGTVLPEIGNKAIVRSLSVIDPEWCDTEVLIVGMDLRYDSFGSIDSARSRIMVANSSNQRRDLPLEHLRSPGSCPD